MAKLELEIIKNAGIVGAGGAGFPTHVKLDSKVETLIINGAECEPLINVDKQILAEYFEKVFEGIKTAAELTGAKKIIIALKKKYREAIEVTQNFSSKNIGSSGIGEEIKFEIFELDNFYPAGDEQILVYEVTGKIVPEDGIPLQVGVVVINVETLLNVSNALGGENVIRKYVTVNGEVKNPLTLSVPVGTPVKELIEFCGGITVEEFGILDGGPMMGKVVDMDLYAVKKTTKSIIVLPEENIVIKNKRRSIKSNLKKAQAICLSCRMCTDLCPRYLLGHDIFPDELMKKMYKGELDEQELEIYDFAYLCCDCGLCELYGCVVDLSPRSVLNYIKEELAGKGIKNTHKRKDTIANEFREFRKVPFDRLEKRLEVDRYSSRAPLTEYSRDVGSVKLYLTQHVGSPSEPVVQVGDSVDRGQLVAEIPEEKLGANIHSSINGRVSEINSEYILIKK